MKPSRLRCRVGLALLIICLAAAANLHAQTFLTPGIDLDIGYDDNRFRVPDGEGGAFLAFSPVLDLTAFAGEGLEVDAGVRHSRSEFLDSDLGATEGTRGSVTLSSMRAPWDGLLHAAVGRYEDELVPADDNRWIELTPLLRFTDPLGRELSLFTRWVRTDYESLLAEPGSELRSTLWDIGPQLALPWGRSAAFWLTMHAEWMDSNQAADEYQGLGLDLGISSSPAPRLRVAAETSADFRDYPNDLVPVVENRSDVLLLLRAWATYRLSPGLELVVSGAWESQQSTQEEIEMDTLWVRAGIRVLYEFALKGD